MISVSCEEIAFTKCFMRRNCVNYKMSQADNIGFDDNEMQIART